MGRHSILLTCVLLAGWPAMARAQNPDSTRAMPTPDTVRARQPVTLPSVTLVVPPADPWRGYSRRGVAYVAVMSGGLVLMTGKETDPRVTDTGSYKRPKNRPGLALAAAAGVAALADALITSRRIRAAVAGHPSGSSPQTGFLPPSLDAEGRSVRLALVRYDF